MAALLIILSFITLLVGLVFLSEATTGVGILAAACFFAILARIAQASAQHKDVQKLLASRVYK